jgi:hypothetical protein
MDTLSPNRLGLDLNITRRNFLGTAALGDAGAVILGKSNLGAWANFRSFIPVDFTEFRQFYMEKQGKDLERLKAMRASAGYKEGDPDAVTAYYRIHFKQALKRQEDFEKSGLEK